ncbi:MAG: toprim domain-containing protein, partial [Ktedonobacterales bacterium]
LHPKAASFTAKQQRTVSNQQRSRGVVVVEGPFDLLTALAWCLPTPCVALVGTYANAQQAAEVMALAQGGPIWLALDADVAGDTGATRLQAQLALAGCGAQVRRLPIPEHAKDLSELVMSPTARRMVAMTLADADTRQRTGGN